MGTGGKVSSLNKPVEKPREQAPRAGAVKRRPIQPTEFRRFYERGDLPIQICHGSPNSILWKIEVKQLDYHHYLPIFMEGIREKVDPHRFLAVQGVFDLLQHGQAKVLPVIPQLIIPIKRKSHLKVLKIQTNTLGIRGAQYARHRDHRDDSAHPAGARAVQ
jgi:hypothetical protein